MGQPVMQWQILAKQPDKLADFYTKLFDWDIDTNNALNYRMVDTGSERGINGGIWPAPPQGPSLVLVCTSGSWGRRNLCVEGDRARRQSRHAIQQLPDGDVMHIILDLEGIPVGIFKPAAV